MTERKDIGARLENWARWNTAAGSRVSASQTGAICERLRRATLGEGSNSQERRVIDEADALHIERAMRDLAPKPRLLLWWCYIRQAPPEVICRKLSIPVRPMSEFVEQFRAAQAAIEDVVERPTSG